MRNSAGQERVMLKDGKVDADWGFLIRRDANAHENGDYYMLMTYDDYVLKTIAMHGGYTRNALRALRSTRFPSKAKCECGCGDAEALFCYPPFAKTERAVVCVQCEEKSKTLDSYCKAMEEFYQARLAK
jgi:hypothetical protein